MARTLIEEYEALHSSYERLIASTDESFHAVKTKNLVKRQKLQAEEEVLHQELRQQVQTIQSLLKEMCRERGVREETAEALLPYLSVGEKEKLHACQRAIRVQDERLKENLKSTLQLTKAMMEVNQQEMDAAVYLLGKAGPQGKNGLFIDRRL